jgi:hypothetical protein
VNRLLFDVLTSVCLAAIVCLPAGLLLYGLYR